MTNTPMTRENVLLDLYKIHAYIPNDEQGNPLTPFGNFVAGYEVFEEAQAKVTVQHQAVIAQQASVIAELVEAIKNLKMVKGRHNTQIACDRLFALLPKE